MVDGNVRFLKNPVDSRNLVPTTATPAGRTHRKAGLALVSQLKRARLDARLHQWDCVQGAIKVSFSGDLFILFSDTFASVIVLAGLTPRFSQRTLA